MTSKGFADNTNNIETPNDIKVTEKPLNPNKISSGRVDIKKNIFIFSFCVLLLGSIGIFLSL